MNEYKVYKTMVLKFISFGVSALLYRCPLPKYEGDAKREGKFDAYLPFICICNILLYFTFRP